MVERREDLLNSRDVARILDLSPDTVNEFARKHILPAFKRGKRWRFARKDIFSFHRRHPKDHHTNSRTATESDTPRKSQEWLS